MKRAEILDSAKEIVTEDREQDYGSPEDSFAVIADFWTIYVREKCSSIDADVYITPSDVAVMMILLKVARVAKGKYKEDSYIDMAGYAACGGELEGKANE